MDFGTEAPLLCPPCPQHHEDSPIHSDVFLSCWLLLATTLALSWKWLKDWERQMQHKLEDRIQVTEVLANSLEDKETELAKLRQELEERDNVIEAIVKDKSELQYQLFQDIAEDEDTDETSCGDCCDQDAEEYAFDLPEQDDDGYQLIDLKTTLLTAVMYAWSILIWIITTLLDPAEPMFPEDRSYLCLEQNESQENQDEDSQSSEFSETEGETEEEDMPKFEKQIVDSES